MVKKLLKWGADPNFRNETYDMTSIARIRGISGFYFQDNKYYTSLFAAIKNEHKEVVEILLRAEANPNI